MSIYLTGMNNKIPFTSTEYSGKKMRGALPSLPLVSTWYSA